jgi:medium-chain acyl-[acyl-carrier-protein] hydrolase
LTLHDGKINDYISDRPCPISRPSRVKVSAPEPVRSLEMRYSDIDINGHVNSVKYIEHILDLFPVDMFQEKHLKRFEIAYIMESYFGDTLSFFSEKTGEDEYDIEIRKNGAEPVCRSKVIFE